METEEPQIKDTDMNSLLMLEHQMMMIENVSDSSDLFRKELIKSIKWLDVRQLCIFKSWVVEKFNGIYGDIIGSIFSSTSSNCKDMLPALIPISK
jgi:hypothetical protein